MGLGPQMGQMMSGEVSQALNIELQIAKSMASQEIPDDAAHELLKELDSDHDGIISRVDFAVSARRALFDPNPPEEMMQMMDMIESAALGSMGGMPAGYMIT